MEDGVGAMVGHRGGEGGRVETVEGAAGAAGGQLAVRSLEVGGHHRFAADQGPQGRDELGADLTGGAGHQDALHGVPPGGGLAGVRGRSSGVGAVMGAGESIAPAGAGPPPGRPVAAPREA